MIYFVVFLVAFIFFVFGVLYGKASAPHMTETAKLYIVFLEDKVNNLTLMCDMLKENNKGVHEAEHAAHMLADQLDYAITAIRITRNCTDMEAESFINDVRGGAYDEVIEAMNGVQGDPIDDQELF
jgi:hypothetical protein